MYPKTHIISGAIFTMLLALTGNFSFLALLIIFASSFLIDVDHWFIYVKRTGDISVKNSYDWFIALKKRRKAALKRDPKAKLPKLLCIFHTIELFIAIIIISIYSPFFYWVLIGISFHLLLDFISELMENDCEKDFSLIHYILMERK